MSSGRRESRWPLASESRFRFGLLVLPKVSAPILVISVLVAGALAGAFNLPIAVLGRELSEFLVIGSGLRMLRA